MVLVPYLRHNITPFNQFFSYFPPPDLRLWPGPRRGARSVQAHDPGGGHTVLPGAGDPDGRPPLLRCRGRVVRGVHLWRAARPPHSVPGPEPGAAGKLHILQRFFRGSLNSFFFFQQLELITELLGTPTLEDMRHACEGARTHMLRRAPKPPSLSALYTLSTHATHEAVHLLCQMLVFDPVSWR